MYKLRNIIKKYISEKNINLIFDFLNKNNINSLKFIDENTIQLKFYKKNHIGGDDESKYFDVYLDKNKYQIRLYKYAMEDDNNFTAGTLLNDTIYKISVFINLWFSNIS